MAVGNITQQNTQPGLSNTEPGGTVLGGVKCVRNSVVGAASYTTGGDSLTPAQLGFGSEGVILWATVSIKATTGTNSGAVAARYDEVNQKLQCFATSGVSPVTIVEVASAANLSGLTFDVIAYGYPLS